MSRGRDIFLIQPTCPPVNENIMELLVMIDCFKRASAFRVTTVIPYFGYARQDRKDSGRVPITAKLVANIITRAGADRVLAMDLHAPQIQGFFDVPVDHLYGAPVLNDHFKTMGLAKDDIVVVSADEREHQARPWPCHAARRTARHRGQATRLSRNDQTENLIGASVSGKIALMFDDMISTGSSITGAANVIRQQGAREIHVAATHGVLCGPAIQRITDAPIDSLVITDSIPLTPEKMIPKIKVISASVLLGQAIKRIHRNESVSNLFS